MIKHSCVMDSQYFHFMVNTQKHVQYSVQVHTSISEIPSVSLRGASQHSIKTLLTGIKLNLSFYFWPWDGVVKLILSAVSAPLLSGNFTREGALCLCWRGMMALFVVFLHRGKNHLCRKTTHTTQTTLSYLPLVASASLPNTTHQLWAACAWTTPHTTHS